MEKLLEQLGYTTPFIYSAAAYWLFRWLDENASDEAKAALASTMKLSKYRDEQVAAALVEVFDRLYTYPLMSLRAFLRSTCFTLIVTTIYLLEFSDIVSAIQMVILTRTNLIFIAVGVFYSEMFVTNILTDYISLFAIRRSLVNYGSKPIFALSIGILLGAIIINVGTLLRSVFGYLAVIGPHFDWYLAYFEWLSHATVSISAMMVFAWLPLFAFGILMIRALAPFAWVVIHARWLLKDGKEHPLKAIGCVAAIFVFAIAAGRQLIFQMI
jgi:hypothetical protein